VVSDSFGFTDIVVRNEVISAQKDESVVISFSMSERAIPGHSEETMHGIILLPTVQEKNRVPRQRKDSPSTNTGSGCGNTIKTHY
jgi:hypothetical protein